jgi:lipocalin
VEHDLDTDPDALYVHNQASVGGVDGPKEGSGLSDLLSAVVINGERGQLAVGPSFLPPVLYGPYWVVAAGAHGNSSGLYDWAVVSGGPPSVPSNGACRNSDPVDPEGNGEGLWLFFRTPSPDAAAIAHSRAVAAAAGFDLSVLVDVVSAGCKYLPWPSEK